jgi:hypothetical protein
LKNLTFLDVSANSLSGAVPTELGKLENLVTLGLANNDFSGSVPTEFANLVKLGEFIQAICYVCYFCSVANKYALSALFREIVPTKHGPVRSHASGNLQPASRK